MGPLKNYLFAFLSSLLLIMGGCSDITPEIKLPFETTIQEKNITLPIAEYGERLRYKTFGEFIQDRFGGFHAGDDIEYANENKEVPVRAIGNGSITHIGKTAGYGGLIMIQHEINGTTITALYGHLDLSSTSLKKGDAVEKGEFLANLGDDKSEETDGERKHLHFALHEGVEVRWQGYESSQEKVSSWINPYDFFLKNGVQITKTSRKFEPASDLGGEIFQLQFTIPAEWEAEYIPSLQALNLFTLSGLGTARDRSQIFLRYFDASQFLTLPTVTIYETNDLIIGTKNYGARRYDIEKKPGVLDFKDQPAWRNKRHIVTDFRSREGFTRYYVVAAKPALDKRVHESVLASMTILSGKN